MPASLRMAKRKNSPALTEASLESLTIHTKERVQGRRLYLGNLAYTTEEEHLKAFFQNYEVYVISFTSDFQFL